jgi:hypothetical protein
METGKLIQEIFVLIVPFVIYLDAAVHNIGRMKNEKRRFLKGWSALNWALCCVALGPIGFILYAFKRPFLIQNAKQYPVITGKYKMVLAVVGLILLSFIFLDILFASSNIVVTPHK